MNYVRVLTRALSFFSKWQFAAKTRLIVKDWEEYKPGEASRVMADVLALNNSSMVERL